MPLATNYFAVISFDNCAAGLRIGALVEVVAVAMILIVAAVVVMVVAMVILASGISRSSACSK